MTSQAGPKFSIPTELRQRLIFVVLALIVFRLGTFIPVPGVNPEAMLQLMERQKGTVLDLFNMFSGGALERMSVLALNVVPYISASIIMQLLASMVPSLQALRKEGESGRRKITQWTRYGTVGLASFQSFGVALALQAQTLNGGGGVVVNPGPGFVISCVIGLTAGTLFLMWLGEQITERGVGNGISLLIFAGIVAGLPGALIQTLRQVGDGQLAALSAILIGIIVVLTTCFVVFMERGQRRIAVNYARKGGGDRGYNNQSSHLPLKINMSGVIPAIFASSFIMFPATLASMGNLANNPWLTRMSAMLSPGSVLYLLVFSLLIIAFAFFYTAMVFNSQETAENLKKSGALIPGIRPGKATGDYVDGVLTRLTGVGAMYLVAVCLLPTILQTKFGVPFYFGGTSLLIVVVVVMDFTAQVQAHLMSHQYEGLLKKANLKNYGRRGLVR
ncbi:MAG: preprotein translocase subunit SecY [Lysobacterales bacterium CG02_land_8_20_14_3_00_62_12]|nr:MAG: preprotein translocase subunit SecY [Xanthomonadales bacterium CG02_land_8_20_14_3_00_62_12]